MNNISIIRLLVLIPLLAQGGAPDDSSPPSSTSRVQGAWPWVLGTVAGGAICRWAYNKWLPSPEKRANEAELAFKECLQRHKKGPVNSNGLPAQCSDEALEFLLRCEFLRQPELKVNEALTSFKQYQDNK